MPQRISASKLAAEFVVIFVSVILALLADDWRANRLLIAEERNALEAMMRDLAEDETDLNRLSGRLDGFEENAQFAVAGMLEARTSTKRLGCRPSKGRPDTSSTARFTRPIPASGKAVASR